jgi:hypothetical protein
MSSGPPRLRPPRRPAGSLSRSSFLRTSRVMDAAGQEERALRNAILRDDHGTVVVSDGVGLAIQIRVANEARRRSDAALLGSERRRNSSACGDIPQHVEVQLSKLSRGPNCASTARDRVLRLGVVEPKFASVRHVADLQHGADLQDLKPRKRHHRLLIESTLCLHQ